MRTSRPWTSDELQMIRREAKRVPVAQLAEKMGRTTEAVRTRMSDLGIGGRNGNGAGRTRAEEGLNIQLGLIVAELIKIHHTLREVINRA